VLDVGMLNMVKLLLKQFHIHISSQVHKCSNCGLDIVKGQAYRKSDNPNLVKLHEHCFKKLCVDGIIILAKNVKSKSPM